MKKTNKKGFTKVELIIVIVVIAVLIAALIPAYIGLANQKKMQEQTQQEIDQLTSKIEQMIKDAVDNIKHPESSNVTAEQIEQMIKDALADVNFPENSGLTAEDVEEIIAEALAGIESGVTEEQVKAAIVEAIKALEGKYLTKEEVIELIEKILAEQNGKEDDEEVETKVVVDNLQDFSSAIANLDVESITLDANIVLEESFTIDRNVEIDLNGHTITPAKGLEYPNSVVLTVAKNTEVAIKGGTITNRKSPVDPDRDFIYVASGATLVLDNVNIAITVVPEVYWNNTRDLWQMDPAEHHIFTIGNGASLTLNNCDVTVLSPEYTNHPDYERNMSIVGVYFNTNASNSEFVMNGGSFSILSTAPDSTKKTDTFYFAMSDRVVESYANATNTIALNGDVEINVGTLNEKGELNSTNYLFWFGPGYFSGKTYYSGVKTVTMSTGTTFNIDGYSYSLNTGAEKVWDVEGICQKFGTNKAQKEFYNAEEIKYHFTCTDSIVGCTYDAELTLGELAKLVGTVKINGVTYHRCPTCGKGGLQFND